jgi:hypothetical protein
MRDKYSCFVATAILLLFLAAGAPGQDPSTGLTARELKEQIAKLQSIEANEAMGADVKALNHRFLEQRWRQLRALLRKNVEELRSYRAQAGAALTADEVKFLDATIAETEQELGVQSAGPVQTPAVSESTRASVPRSAVVAASSRNENVARAEVEGPDSPSDGPSLASRAQPFSPASFSGPLFPTQDLALKGSDANSNDVIKEDIRRQLGAVIREISRAHSDAGTTLQQARKAAFDITGNPQLYAQLLSLILTNEMLPRDEFIRDIEAARIDKQVGGPPGNAGSTTLVTKGGTPAIIGFAVENGGLTRTVDGTTVTLRGNPLGMVEALQKKGFVTSYQDDSESARLLRKLSFSASFDTSRGDTPGTFLANRQQLSGYSFRYEFKNDRDPRNQKYKAAWEDLVRNHVQQVANDLSWIQRLFDTHPAYSAWLTAAKEAVANASDQDLANVVTLQFESLQQISIPPDLAAKLESFRTDFNAYRGGRSKLLEIIAKAPIFTFEYVNSRRPGLIDTSNFKIIAETGLFKGKGDLTYNGSFTLFNSKPGVGMKRMRDFDNSVRLDIPLGDVRKVGNFVLTFAGQYKRLTEDELPGLNNRGDIASGQLLFTIPLKGTGFKIPVSLSFANRTELLKEKEVRGNFGFTFDLDSIFAKFKPF